ncbi:glycoprotein [Orinoco virus]|uniref:Glycoprotein n=1 Tax=Orinoco virus TaxID=1871345 RepID=A0A1B1FIT8_9MONO|nr:glycoprotein [Orinoco virus]ANQ45641.1 glycoprotein [Orinoco virus]
MTLTAILALLVFGVTLGRGSSSPMICPVDTPPSVYTMPEVNPCSDQQLEDMSITVSYNQSQHANIRGWQMSVRPVTCTTHYFFLGTYTHDIEYGVPSAVDFPGGGNSFVCPPSALVYSSSETLQKDLCEYTWPTRTSTTRDVCYMERASLISIDGMASVNGHPVESCDAKLCKVNDWTIFQHNLGFLPSRSETTFHYSGMARCNKAICIVARLGEAYPLISIVANSTWSTAYRSISGSIITLLWLDSGLSSQEPRLPQTADRSDPATLAKIVKLESSIQALNEEVNNICIGVQNLYTAIRTLSWSSPTAAAALYLNRTDVVAQHSDNYFLVWPCVTIDIWSLRYTVECTKYIPITYTLSDGNKTGYLDTQRNLVYSWSPAADCGPSYVMVKGALYEIHQSTSGSNHRLVTSEARITGKIFRPVPRLASEWSSQSWAERENHPSEFSYTDLTRSPTIGGSSWLDAQIDARYPILRYIIHIKLVAFLLGSCGTTLALYLTYNALRTRRHLRRIECQMAESMRMKLLA